MKLILNDIEALHWLWSGLAIGAITLALLFLANRRLGISTGLEDVCAWISKQPYFGREALRDNSWRITFMVGLLLGGGLSALLGGGWRPTWDLGMFDSVIGWGTTGKIAWMFAGGLFIGFGTRLGNGCTSGHGIFGLANFERSGWQTTITFMATGLLFTNLLYRGIFGG